MIEVSTYLFEPIREDGEFVLYRGRRRDDGSHLPVVGPVWNDPSIWDLTQLEEESSIKEGLDPKWEGQPIAIQCRDGRTMLLLEDPGGESLDGVLAKSLESTACVLVCGWRQPNNAAVDFIRAASCTALESGDLQFGC